MVSIVRGNNLRNTDIVGKLDPYVVCEAGGAKVRTHTVNEDLNPVWHFDCEVEWKDNQDVWFTIFDSDELWSEVMHTVSLSRDQFIDGFDGRLPLGPTAENCYLEVRVRPKRADEVFEVRDPAEDVPPFVPLRVRRRRQKLLMRKTAQHVTSNLNRLAALEKRCRVLEEENASLKDGTTWERLDALEKKSHLVEELEKRCRLLEEQNRELWAYMETREHRGAGVWSL
eukprot:gnl/TRDRNA2_/TRDRNA2_193762_c0_seq1.p1 gnl/TRDRNA2_/TRDRNA2_193762_c0~~gnl/TRDRNA2_/TRDRNA2_193762_c0_seq1.p1  ORF type:complete len:227 (-),score=36.43 gnl/TRDRNA2_/TRDRNA2_193762_c0_seq1:82-762(-)